MGAMRCVTRGSSSTANLLNWYVFVPYSTSIFRSPIVKASTSRRGQDEGLPFGCSTYSIKGSNDNKVIVHNVRLAHELKANSLFVYLCVVIYYLRTLIY